MLSTDIQCAMAAASPSLPNLTLISLVAKPNLKYKGQKFGAQCSSLAKLSQLETTTKDRLQALLDIPGLKKSSFMLLSLESSGKYIPLKQECKATSIYNSGQSGSTRWRDDVIA